MVWPGGWVWNLVLIKIQPPCPTLLAPREMLPPLLYLSRSDSHWAKMTENNGCEICVPQTVLHGWLSYRAQRGEAWLVKSCRHLRSFLSWHCWGCSFASCLDGKLKELCMLGCADGTCVWSFFWKHYGWIVRPVFRCIVKRRCWTSNWSSWWGRLSSCLRTWPLLLPIWSSVCRFLLSLYVVCLHQWLEWHLS